MTDPFAPLRALAEIPDPVERAQQLSSALAQIPGVQTELKDARQAAVLEMRSRNMSHADVGAALGVSRARAQQIAEGRVSGKRKDTEES